MFKIIGLIFILFSPSVIGEVIYNGESHPFSMSAKWDTNESVLIQKSSTSSSFSSPNYLTATINVANGWGGVAYVPKKWKELNLSKALYLQLAVKSSKPTNIAIQLYDSSKVSSNKQIIKVTKDYQFHKIAIDQFTGVDPFTIQAIIFSINSGEEVTYRIDLDDIETIESLDIAK